MNRKKLIKEMRVKTLKEILLEPNAQMRVPNYQRSFAWDSDEINDFVNDLKHLHRCRQDKKIEYHFFGGIVTYEIENPGQTPEKIYEIVDGQQRLLTFSLLLAIIKSEYKYFQEFFERDGDEKYAERAGNKKLEVERAFTYESTDYLGNKHKVPTLIPSKPDNAFFSKVINFVEGRNDIDRDSHRLLRKARNKIKRELIDNYLKNPNHQKYFLDLSLLLECIKQDCQVIFIVCPNLDDAYELFQVLNDRGKSLSDGDLMRAHTVKTVSEISENDHGKIKLLVDYWDEILSESPSKVKHFLEQYYRIQKAESPQKRQLYRQYQDTLFKNLSSVDDIINIIKDMRDKFRLFMKILDGEWPYETNHSAIEDYHKYRLKLLVKVLSIKNVSLLTIASAKLDQPAFKDLLLITEIFFFRYKTICGGSADKVGDAFGKWANLALKDKFDIDEFKNELSQMILVDANDASFRDQLRLALVYRSSRIKQKIRFFLIFLEDHRKVFQENIPKGQRKRETSPIYPVEKSNSIEHIYPQSPPKDIPIDTNITQHQSRGDLTHSLGNLTFLAKTDNQLGGNDLYPEKRQHYQNSGVWLNRILAEQYDEWTAQAVVERENWLLDRAIEVFKLD